MEENKHSINDLLKVAMSNLMQMTDVNLIVGDKIQCGETTIIPISKVKCGFVSGGIDQIRSNQYDQKNPFGGGAGGTVNITPVAFLSINKDEVKVLHLEENSHILEKMIDFIPTTIEKIIKSFKKENDSKLSNMDTNK